MKRLLFALVLLASFLDLPEAQAQTATPTSTRKPTRTPTSTPTVTRTVTPTITPVASDGGLAIVLSDGTAEFAFTYTGTLPYLKVRNISANAVTFKFSAGITETSPGTPTATLGEYILPAGVEITLPRSQATFWHRAGSGAAASLSILATDSP